MNKGIKDYIQFGIENSYKMPHQYKDTEFCEYTHTSECLAVITGFHQTYPGKTSVVSGYQVLCSVGEKVQIDKDGRKEIMGREFNYSGLLNIITSKPFIEAVARGKNPNYEPGTPGYDSVIFDITSRQAIAIRDGKLEEFINIIL